MWRDIRHSSLRRVLIRPSSLRRVLIRPSSLRRVLIRHSSLRRVLIRQSSLRRVLIRQSSLRRSPQWSGPPVPLCSRPYLIPPRRTTSLLFFPLVLNNSASLPTPHLSRPAFSNSPSHVTLHLSHPVPIPSPLTAHPSHTDHISFPFPMINLAFNPAQSSTPFLPPAIHLSRLGYSSTAFRFELGEW